MKETTKNSFLVQLIDFGFKKLVFSIDFVIGLIIFILFFLDRHYQWNIFITNENNTDIKNFIGVVFAIASTMFSITLAALAIILSFSSSEFMAFLRKEEKISGILFPFWLGNASYLLVLVLSTTYLLLKDSSGFPEKYLFPLICAVFVYSLIGTFYLLSTVIKFGYFAEWSRDKIKPEKLEKQTTEKHHD